MIPYLKDAWSNLKAEGNSIVDIIFTFVYVPIIGIILINFPFVIDKCNSTFSANVIIISTICFGVLRCLIWFKLKIVTAILILIISTTVILSVAYNSNNINKCINNSINEQKLQETQFKNFTDINAKILKLQSDFNKFKNENKK